MIEGIKCSKCGEIVHTPVKSPNYSRFQFIILKIKYNEI
ncbi:MAG: hypothetical protein HeimC3_32100 [Candidatus Heimdallarchaeota archaeon LC_3]|nr:MAG: hypothetical protein HeimC3_32100 [Candidatus Heimdallarchaeota archaeon LC_3]